MSLPLMMSAVAGVPSWGGYEALHIHLEYVRHAGPSSGPQGRDRLVHEGQNGDSGCPGGSLERNSLSSDSTLLHPGASLGATWLDRGRLKALDAIFIQQAWSVLL